MHSYKKKSKKEDTGLHPEKIQYIPGKINIVEKPGHRKIRMNTFVGNTNSQVFCARFNNDDKMIVTGTVDGDIKVYDVYQSKTVTLCKSWKKEILPTTCLRWKPPKANNNSNIFISTCADGSLTWFNLSGDVLHRTTMEHALLCCDYSSAGDFVAVGRDDFSICVFDEEHQQLLTTYQGSSEENDNGGHSNRVFSIKCIPDQPKVFISGGWDSKIRYWDIRQKESINSFYGPHISGDSIDYKAGQILTGSYRNEDILQLWSLKNLDLLKTIKIDTKEHPAAYCYTAQFGKKDSSLIAMGMTGCNQVQIYDSKKDYELCGEIQLQGPCYTIDFANNGHMFVCSGAQGVAYILSID